MILPSVRLHRPLAQFLNCVGQRELADRVVRIQRATEPILLLAEVSQESAWSSGVFFPGGDVGVEMVARGQEDDVRWDAFGFMIWLLSHPLQQKKSQERCAQCVHLDCLLPGTNIINIIVV